MIHSISVTNHLGETLLMELRSPEKSGFFIRGIDGLGPSKSNINMTEVLSSDGSFYNSSRLVSRNIVMNLGFYPNVSDSIETIRQKTYRFFPTKRSLQIQVVTDNRIGITNGYVETNEPDIFSKDEGTVISLLCPSAYFLAAESVITTFTGVVASFEFPWENPSLTLDLIEFGSIFVSTAKSVFYAGDEPTGVIVRVNFLGGVSGLSIYNATLGQTMSFDSAKIVGILGSNFDTGDVLTISTLKGQKYANVVRGGITYNVINALGTNPSWFTVERGDNVFTYTATVGLANVQASVEHRVIYKGL